MSSPVTKKEDGSIIIYTVLVLAVVINTIIIISNLVVSEVRQSANFDQSVGSYYVAESGLEKALFFYRHRGITLPDGDCGLFGMDCDLTVTIDSAPVVTYDVSENESFQVNFDNQPSNIQSMRVLWDNTGFNWVEVSYTEWNSGLGDWDEANVNKVMLSGGSGMVNAFAPGNRYKVRVKALAGEADNLSISFFDQNNGAGNIINIPDSIKFEARGEKNNSVQQVSASMPPAQTLHGIFDYVLFSESLIKK